MQRPYNYLLFVAGLLLFMVGQSQAQDVIRTVGFGFSDDPPDRHVMKSVDGDSVVTSRYYYFNQSDSPDWPDALINCFSTVSYREGVISLASGSCVRSDEEGDHASVLFWTVPDEPGSGLGLISGGTGKYTNRRCDISWEGDREFFLTPARWFVKTEMKCRTVSDSE